MRCCRFRSYLEGLLYVDNRSPRAFTDQHESVLVRLAAHAAIAIRNAQILEAEQLARGTARSWKRPWTPSSRWTTTGA